MLSAEYELRYLQAGVEVLENYLLSNDVYWQSGATPPAGQPPYPQLTLAGLELARVRASTAPLTPEQRARLASLEEQIDAARARWRVAWGKKAANEFRARLTLWRNYLEDYREQPESNADRYPYEAARRVQLAWLGQEAGDLPPAETQMLEVLDKLLRAVLAPGPFVWEAELEPAFPRDPYWYLYGRLKKD